MKKITIILIIVLCLLYFIEISCLAEEPSSLTPGNFWNNSGSEEAKLYLIVGFMLGMGGCLDKLTSIPIGGRGDSNDVIVIQELVDLHNFLKNHLEAVYNIVDDLYKDPANTYIQLAQMIEVACQKLKGEDIEPLLQEARKEALQNQ